MRLIVYCQEDDRHGALALTLSNLKLTLEIILDFALTLQLTYLQVVVLSLTPDMRTLSFVDSALLLSINRIHNHISLLHASQIRRVLYLTGNRFTCVSQCDDLKSIPSEGFA